MKCIFGYILIAAIVVSAALAPLHAQLLIREPTFKDPVTYTLNAAWTQSWLNIDLFGQVYSSSPACIIDTLFNIYHVIEVYADPCWNRLIYFDETGDQATRLRDHSQFGYGVDSLLEPMAVKVISPTSDEYPYSTYYNIYVADRGNHRVQRLRYRWTTPDSGLIHNLYYTNQVWRPTDLDVSNSGTFDIDWDDIVWIACKDNRIHSFQNSSYYLMSYGSTGSGTGQFNDIRAIVCGKTRYNSATDTWFANNNYLYVLDAGNSRIVRLLRITAFELQWQGEICWPTLMGTFTDLEVDALGQIWATSANGQIFKFTSSLAPLGDFGSDGTGPNQFDNPVSIGNTGGHLGGGDMMICENWTAASGLQHYAIGVDVTDLAVNTELRNDTCWSHISFNLADYGSVTVLIYNNSGGLIRHLVQTAMPSGVILVNWNGTNDSQHLVSWGNYRVEVTAVSQYINKDTGLPVNTVTKNVWVTLCGTACNWQVGDADGNAVINISDVVYVIGYVFNGTPVPQPNAVGSADADCSHAVNISDVVSLIGYVFNSTPVPGSTCACADYR